MLSWTAKRKILYILSSAIVLASIASLVFYKFYYKAQTCTDGIQNQDEKGVDCGGICPKICSSFFLSPGISWARAEKIGDGIYNFGAYIINPNASGGVKKVKYSFKSYDNDGIPVAERSGVAYIPPHKNILVFESGINTQKNTPSKVVFEFEPNIKWDKFESKENLIIENKNYTEDQNVSSLEAELVNRDLRSYNNIDLSAILYDVDKNVIGFSKTRLDFIDKGGRESIGFTWPKSNLGKVVSIEIIPTLSPQ